MLFKVRHGTGTPSLSSNFFKIFTLYFHLSPFSPNPNHRTRKTSRTSSKLPIPDTSRDPQISSQSVVSSPDALEICSLLVSERNATEITNFDSLLEEYREKLNSQLVLEILMNYRQLGRMNTIKFFSWAGNQMGFKFDDCVVEYMADFLGRRKLFDDMKCFLLTVLSHKGEFSAPVFSTCIRFLGRQGRIREALCLFQEMESRFHCKPNNFVYNNMLYVLCKKDKSGEFIDVAISIFRMIESPDTYSYSNIIVGLCKFGRFEAAVQVFREMNKVRLMPTRSAVNVLIGNLCLLSMKEGAVEKVKVKSTRKPFTILVPNVSSKCGAIVPAISAFWAVSDLGLLPSSFVIIRLMTELCRLGKMKEAFQILDVVENRRLNCLEESYSILMQALCENRRVEEASDLFGRMLSQELKPKLAVYNSVICMLCKLGKLNDAKRVVEIMKRKQCLLDNATYTALVHAYIEAQDIEIAYELLTEMLGFNHIPHFNTYSLVEKLLKENERMDLLIKLERKMESQILLKFCKMGRLEAAYGKLKGMIDKGIDPPMYVRDAFKNAFQKRGKLHMARELLEKVNGSRKLEETETTSFVDSN